MKYKPRKNYNAYGSSLRGLVIGVLSVSCSSELLLSLSASVEEHIHSTTDEDHFKSTGT